MASPAKKMIDGFSLDNILQISSMENKSQTMSVRTLDRLGFLYMELGELIDARTGELTGYDAAIEILCWDDPQIELTTLEPRQRSIEVPLIKILLNVSKAKDEREYKLRHQGLELLEQSIELAEAHQYKAAHKSLVSYLKKHKDNTGGWIWYSRIHGNLEAMEKALMAAHRISSHDPFVVEERKKFLAIRDELIGQGIRKCLFCWAPLNKQAICCHHCSGYLTINQEALTLDQRPSPAFFKTAIKRYSRVSEKFPGLLAAQYCLSLANLNLGNLKEALQHLDKVVKQAPEKKIFSSQFDQLKDYLASLQLEADAVDTSTAVASVAGETSGVDPKIEEIQESRKTILVVEDSSTIRKVITATLKRNGYDFVEAEDGLEALSRVSESKPDLILLDVVLPKMDGFKILSIIKGNKNLKEIPVIMLTSKDGFINKVKGKMGGANAYLTKPFDPTLMIREIEKHI